MHLHRKFLFFYVYNFLSFWRWLFPTNCLAGENVNQSSIKCQSNQHRRPKSHWTPLLIGPHVFLFQFLSIRKSLYAMYRTCQFRGLAYSFNISTALVCKTLSFLNATDLWPTINTLRMRVAINPLLAGGSSCHQMPPQPTWLIPNCLVLGKICQMIGTWSVGATQSTKINRQTLITLPILLTTQIL